MKFTWPYLVVTGVLFTLFAGYSFMNAASWTAPTGTPPADNVPAPINVGTITQEKEGTLGVNSLAVFGASSFTGVATFNNKLISNSNSPALELIDASPGEKDWRIGVDGGDDLVVRADRNQNGDWNDDGYPPPLFLRSGATSSEDFAVFSNKVRATEYCDENGANCFKASDVTPKTCQVRIDGTSMSSGGTVYTAKSQTVPIQQGTEPRIGGYFQCNTRSGDLNYGYMTAQVGYDSWCWSGDCNFFEGGGSRSAGGYWSEEDYLINSIAINGLQENSIGSFTVNPGVTLTVTASAVNTGNDCDKRDMRVTATVLSCAE